MMISIHRDTLYIRYKSYFTNIHELHFVLRLDLKIVNIMVQISLKIKLF